MPTDHCLRLDDLQRIQHLWGQTINPGKHQVINVAEVHLLRRSAPQHIELMPQQNDFGLQRSLRPEQSDHCAPDQPTKITHRKKVSSDSQLCVSHFEFSVGTGEFFNKITPKQTSGPNSK